MHGLVLAGLLLGAVDFGDAPKDTLKPAEAMERLAAKFKNAEFTATQTYHLDRPDGLVSTVVTDLHAFVCDDAVVIKQKEHHKYVKSPRHGVEKPRTEYRESRWGRNESWLELQLRLDFSEMWPIVAAEADDVSIEYVIARQQEDDDNKFIWSALVTGDFIADVGIYTGITLVDMVTERGRRGYSLQSVKWASADRATKVAYRFKSADYGTTTIVFSKSRSEWLPTNILIERSGENMLAAPGSTGAGVRLGTSPVDGFSKSVRWMDRHETNYEISYNSTAPAKIKRTETYSAGAERVVYAQTMTFRSLRSGGISAADVRKAMLPIPDGTEVHYGDPDLQNFEWTTKNGKVIMVRPINSPR